MIQLFIQNKEIELTEDVSVQFEKTFLDLENPVLIKSEFSKEVKVPITIKNEKVMSQMNNLDRVISSDGTSTTGIYFDPYVKNNFRLEVNGDVIATGYAKYLYSDWQYYYLTLNGDLGGVLQDIKKLTFDPDTEDTYYLLDPDDVRDIPLNSNSIVKCLTEGSDTIGWTINNSYVQNTIDYKLYQKGTKFLSFSEVLEKDKSFAATTGISASDAIGEGLLPLDIGELKPYLQYPYMHTKYLFRILEDWCKEKLGVSFDYDTEFFTDTNPLWNKSVFMLKALSPKSSKQTRQSTLKWEKQSIEFPASEDRIYSGTYESKFGMSDKTVPSGNDTTGVYDEATASFKVESGLNLATIHFQFGCEVCWQDTTQDTEWTWQISRTHFLNPAWHYMSTNAILIDIELWNRVTERKESSIKKIAITSSIPENTVKEKVEEEGYELVNWAPSIIDCDVMILPNNESLYIRIFAKALYPNLALFSSSNLQNFDGTSYTGSLLIGTYSVEPPIQGLPEDTSWPKYAYQDSEYSITLREGYPTSYSVISLNDLWDQEYSPYDIFINYIKAHNLIVYYDQITKSLKVRQRKSAYSDYTIKDITNIVDMSSLKVYPVQFEDKGIYFNYRDDGETAVDDLYSDISKYNFGEQVINTNYQYNDDLKEMFEDKLDVVKTISPVIKSWTLLYDNVEYAYYQSNLSYICSYDSDNKQVNLFGQFGIYLGLSSISSDDKLRPLYMYDDTDLQLLKDVRCYTQSPEKGHEVKYFPAISSYSPRYTMIFGDPKTIYTLSPITFPTGKNLYNSLWKDFIEEIYNYNNKKVVITAHLGYNFFNQASYNTFLRIGNQIFSIIKITNKDNDFNTYELELLSIQDPTNYTTNKLQENYIKNNYGRES